jgi:hypothetical protein
MTPKPPPIIRELIFNLLNTSFECSEKKDDVKP